MGGISTRLRNRPGIPSVGRFFVACLFALGFKCGALPGAEGAGGASSSKTKKFKHKYKKYADDTVFPSYRGGGNDAYTWLHEELPKLEGYV